MAKFVYPQHKRFRTERKERDVSLTVDVRPKRDDIKRRSLLNLEDRVTIRLQDGEYQSIIRLNSEEIDSLIYELSRLKRFHNPELKVEVG